MNKEEKAAHIKQLWNKARRYNNKLRFQARLQKMTESNLKEMMIDDINEEAEEEASHTESQPKLKWYLIDRERTFCKVWNFMITMLVIYTLVVSPYVVVFPTVYEWCEYTDGSIKESLGCKASGGKIVWNETLRKIELAFDIIFFIEILMNFVKRSRAYYTLPLIAHNYLLGQFIFDVVATLPCLFMGETIDYYILKFFRIIHVTRLTQPLQVILGCALQKYSKKRQNDLTSFASLIFYVIYVSHLMACAWLYLGQWYSCVNEDGTGITGCTKSWVYAAGFDDKPKHTQYIFAFYWIFEVITTVGYGDYSGSTSGEYIFSIALEFLGLTFFSFLMGSINSIFNTSDNFDDLIEEKLDSLDMWIKKIEKSNKPFHIQPTLYNDIRKYVEQAFLYDFNLVIEEFPFYQQITPKMQTDLIQNTRVFKEFEKSFNHFFEECERGFTNEMIINMFCRIQNPGKVVISYKSNVKEMFFIRQGLVEVYNNENDEEIKDKPILYLPKYSYFGDYQILYNLKSNLLFKTLAHTPDDKKGSNDHLPDIIFMCCSNEHLNEFCDLFPQTAENIKRRSLQRRKKFMEQKNTNSKRFKDQQKAKEEQAMNKQPDSSTEKSQKQEEENLEEFYTSEEHENFDSQKEDMKQYLNNLNKRIDVLVDALKQADSMMSKMGDQKGIIEQINQKKNARAKGGKTGENDRRSIADFFKDKIKDNKK